MIWAVEEWNKIVLEVLLEMNGIDFQYPEWRDAVFEQECVK